MGVGWPENTREMRAMLVYIKWLGQDHPMNSPRFGSSLLKLEHLDRAANPEFGAKVFSEHCASCHGSRGEGLLKSDGISYVYPPLWGDDSYSIGSSMHRVSAAAAFIKANMPFGTTWEDPVLTDEEAYDVAAFINDDGIHPRPLVDISRDYPDLFEKPIDYPTGLYIDSFSEEQHKFGPWKPINEERKRKLKARGKSRESAATPSKKPYY